MRGPNGRTAREAMIRGFFVADTTPAVQTKVLNMMLSAPEATADSAMNATFDPGRANSRYPDGPDSRHLRQPPVASRDAVCPLP